MSKFTFAMNLPAPVDKLIEIASDFESFSKYQTQVKDVKIIERLAEETITEEKLVFMKQEVLQRSSHKKTNSNKLSTKILSGPLKGSTMEITFEKLDSGTRVSVEADLKVSLKYKFLSPLIKKNYKLGLTAIMYKMNTEALEYSV